MGIILRIFFFHMKLFARDEKFDDTAKNTTGKCFSTKTDTSCSMIVTDKRQMILYADLHLVKPVKLSFLY